MILNSQIYGIYRTIHMEGAPENRLNDEAAQVWDSLENGNDWSVLHTGKAAERTINLLQN